ncbi:hypothetical protein HK100_006585, partial [Physocladia obscura]
MELDILFRAAEYLAKPSLEHRQTPTSPSSQQQQPHQQHVQQKCWKMCISNLVDNDDVAAADCPHDDSNCIFENATTGTPASSPGIPSPELPPFTDKTGGEQRMRY